MKIYIASDHAGFEMKKELKDYLPKLGLGYEVVDMGPMEVNPEDDYPDFVTPMAKKVVEEGAMGIAIGGSGQGEAMCANRISGARAIVFYGQENPKAKIDQTGTESADSFEIVKLGRSHNDANIISLGARFLSMDEVKFAVELFLSTPFSDDERHKRRLNKF